MWGGPPWSAADAPVGLLVPRQTPISLFRMRDEGVPRGPGGPPHEFRGISPGIRLRGASRPKIAAQNVLQ